MKGNVNLVLKAELIRRFGTQVEAAHRLGIRENRLSYIIRGHTKPSTKEIEVLETVLGQRVARRLLGESLSGGAR